jgi:hypothetical protein
MVYTASPQPRRSSLYCALALALFSLAWAAPAAGQLVRVSPSSGPSTVLFTSPDGIMLATDIAYDPAHNVYLALGAHGPVWGQFADASGNAIGPTVLVSNGTFFGHHPRAFYSQDCNNGQGGFLVLWHENSGGGATNAVHAVVVSYPSGVISGDQTVSDYTPNPTYWQQYPAVAYSATSHRFLVAWVTTPDWALQARFVDVNGTPFGSIFHVITPHQGNGLRDPQFAWNAATDEFGMSYSGWSPAYAGFLRIRASDGLVSLLSTFGNANGTFSTSIDVNPFTHNYVMIWYAAGQGTQAIAFDQNGNSLGTGLVSSGLGGPDDETLELAFNPISRTFMAGGYTQGAEAGGVELNANGAPDGPMTIVTGGATTGSFNVRVAANLANGQWAMSYAQNLKTLNDQVIGTTSTNGGSTATLGGAPPPPPPGGGGGGGGGTGGCTTPDPFASLGGGTCVNGGWHPPTGGTPPPPPPPPPGGGTGGCTTPDPFASLGGGTCVNGGWHPPTGGTPPPPPPPPPGGGTGGCTTPDPFASLGGGTCANGGWKPPTGGTPPPPPPPPPGGGTGGCTTPDPFTSLGGGTCFNGGWLPPGSPLAPPTLCGGLPDPFKGLPNLIGVCVNGGWVPHLISAPVPAPTSVASVVEGDLDASETLAGERSGEPAIRFV